MTVEMKGKTDFVLTRKRLLGLGLVDPGLQEKQSMKRRRNTRGSTGRSSPVEAKRNEAFTLMRASPSPPQKTITCLRASSRKQSCEIELQDTKSAVQKFITCQEEDAKNGSMMFTSFGDSFHRHGKTSVLQKLLSPLDRASGDEIRKHLTNLRRESIVRSLNVILNKLTTHALNRGVFNAPVDPTKLGIPEYFHKITTPMDLKTVKQKLLCLEYQTADDFADDIRLVFQNAIHFNPQGHPVHTQAEELQAFFEIEFIRFKSRQLNKSNRTKQHSCEECLANVCGMCGEKCLNFEPPLLVCSGSSCGGQRIRRFGIYFHSHEFGLSWCPKCFSGLSPSFDAADDQGITHVVCKQSLIKLKFSDEITEPWVQCDYCDRWVHQVCALFNARENAMLEVEMKYQCPLCRLRDFADEESNSTRPFNDVKHPVSDSLNHHGYSCAYLPETTISKFMQEWIQSRVQKTADESVASSLFVREVSSILTDFKVDQDIRKHFQINGAQYPEVISYVSKLILLFQRIDGMDVCVFSMYVQEYGRDCEAISNRRRVYIAYLDSLGYVRPRRVRTQIFQDTVIAYLSVCQKRGFQYAHIWSCPPTRGSDFLYWCHPPFQKNPSQDRLRAWYDQVLRQAKAEGVIHCVNDLYQTHFQHVRKGLCQASALKEELPPLFHGDCWTLEVRRLLDHPVAAVSKTGGKPGLASSSTSPLDEEQAMEDFNSISTRQLRWDLAGVIEYYRHSLIVMELQQRCSMCSSFMVSEERWVPNVEDSSFNTIRCRHCHGKSFNSSSSTGHDPAVIKAVLPDGVGTEELNEDHRIISNPFVDSRATLLQKCEELHYQFDSFRRAKYSTMMLLHHLHVADHQISPSLKSGQESPRTVAMPP